MIRSRQISFLRQLVAILALTGGARTAFAGAGPVDPPTPAAQCAAELSTDLARFAGTVVVHEEDGRVHPVENLRIEEFTKLWPEYAALATSVGWSRADSIEVARALLQKPSDSMLDPAEKSRRLAGALGAAADRGLSLKASVPQLLAAIERFETYDLTAHAFYNLGFALRAGLDPARALDVFTIIADRRAYLGLHTFNNLQDVLKTMDEYAVPADVADATLRTVLAAPNFEDGVLSQISAVIKHDVLVLGLAADFSLRDLRSPSLATQLDKRLRAKPRGARPSFPLITGRLRHAPYPYVLERSYEDGLQDLRVLALDETCLIEGAFVFSPERNLWYSLGGSTAITAAAVRHTFVEPDWSAFGPSPKFVHVHPRELEFMARPPRATLLATILGPLVNRFAALLPSQKDLSLLIKMNSKRANRDFELQIVTQTGVTNVVAGPDERASRHRLPYLPHYRDEVYSGLVTDYIGLTPHEQLDGMLTNLNDRLRGAFVVTLNPWRTP